MCDSKELSPRTSCEPLGKRSKIASPNVGFSSEDVQNYLFGATPPCATEGLSSLVSTFEQPSCYEELPNIVRFCISSVPGAGYGVEASRVIPEGAWIGPYSGRLVRPEEIMLDSSHQWEGWEIFKDGKLKAYIDGSDQNSSSWMRFIRCARHKQEQNLYAFQYREKIYYRAFKTINPGKELLVWYDDIYTQYLGIPCQGIYDMASSKGPTKFPGSLVVVAAEEGLPATPPTSPGRTPDGSPTETEQSDVRNRLLRKSSQDLTTPNLSRPPPLQSRSVDLSVINMQCRKVNTADRKEMRCSPGQVSDDTVNTYSNVTMTEGQCPSQKDITLQYHNTESVKENQRSPTASARSISPTNEQPLIIQCGQCKKHFTQRSMLHTHICSSITNKPYQCGHCDESFSSPGEMTVHVSIHQERKPFKCGYCSRSFTGATTLNNHVRMHTGEKPFDCFRCGKTFTKGLQLSKHQKLPGSCVPYTKYVTSIMQL